VTDVNNNTDDDLPTELTTLLRNVDGVHTVYATQSVVSTVVGAIVEAVRNDKVGMHLVGVHNRDGRTEVVTCIGVFPDESASVVCRRAHDALRSFFLDSGREAPATIEVKVGRVG
jgi:hypothetical protein